MDVAIFNFCARTFHNLLEKAGLQICVIADTGTVPALLVLMERKTLDVMIQHRKFMSSRALSIYSLQGVDLLSLWKMRRLIRILKSRTFTKGVRLKHLWLFQLTREDGKNIYIKDYHLVL
ncbi:hypothetical protein ACSQ67_007514 [Phaseolus vulgaris]